MHNLIEHIEFACKHLSCIERQVEDNYAVNIKIEMLFNNMDDLYRFHSNVYKELESAYGISLKCDYKNEAYLQNQGIKIHLKVKNE